MGGRPAKLNEIKGDRDLERAIKNKGDTFLLEEQQENFVAAVTMQGENERQWKKVNWNTYDISSIKRVTKNFLEVPRCSRAKQLLLIRPIVVFHRFSALHALSA